MDREVKDFLVFLIEICAREFFCGDKSSTYDVLRKYNILDFYRDTYDVSHTLSSGYIIDEIKEQLTKSGYAI
jgi:hypothetical protein